MMMITKLIQFTKKLSIKKKLLWFVAILTVLVLFMYIYWVISVRKDLLIKCENESLQACSSFITLVSSEINTLESSSKFPVLRNYDGLTSELYTALSSSRSVENNFSYFNEFNRTALRLLELNSFIDTISLYDMDGFGVTIDTSSPYYSIIRAEPSSQWFQEALSEKGRAISIAPDSLSGTGNQQKDNAMVCIVRSVVNASKYENVGVVLLGIKSDRVNTLFDQVRQFPEQTYEIYYSGRKLAGTIDVYSKQGMLPSDLSAPQSRILREGSKQFLYSAYPYQNYVVIIKTPVEAIYAQSTGISILIRFLVGGLLLAALLASWRLAQSIIAPLHVLVSACTQMGEQNFSVRVSGTVPEELNQLYTAFNRMSTQIEALIKEGLLKDLEKKDLTLQFLHSQINPHYLYNTLECIRMNAYTYGNYDAADMAVLLGHNLQYGLRGSHEEVYLFQELESLKDYIKLVTYRYHDSFSIHFHIEDNILNTRCIKLMLQPIVENSLVHAISGSSRILNIDVIGYAEPDMVTIIIADDGPGINPETYNRLLDSFLRPQETSAGIGLKNVHYRIQLLYGAQYGLNIKTQEHVGTSVTITLPAHTLS